MLRKEGVLLRLTLHKFLTFFSPHINTTDDDSLFLKNYNKNYNRVSGVLTKFLQKENNFAGALMFWR